MKGLLFGVCHNFCQVGVLTLLGVLLCVPLVTPAQGSSPRWNLNDVSYLYPFPAPEVAQIENMLIPGQRGSKGELLPRAIYNVLPTLSISGVGNDLIYKSGLRVVAVRIDPCPPDLLAGFCRPEIRLVWQPILLDPRRRKWNAHDASLHTFYRLSQEEFEVVKGELLKLKSDNEAFGVTTESVPLGVHPAFLKPERKEAFTQELAAILMSHCGIENLIKITFMAEFVSGQWWRFGGFDRHHDGTWAAFKVPRLEETIQDIFNIAPEDGLIGESGQEVDVKITVLPKNYPAADDLLPLIDKDLRFDDDQDLPIFADKMDAVARFRNPNATHSLNLDCATCHYADAAHYYAHRRFPQLAKLASQFAYRNPNPQRYDLSNATSTLHATRMLRAFGYFKDQPAISQRVIHDSAASAELLNQQLK